MVYRPKIDPQSCFVLLPLRAPFLGYFDQIIKPAALEAGLEAVKADDIYGTRAVIRDIWDLIWSARAVVAIVTDQNPNVNYELGMCHTLGVPTILVTERSEDVPFDYRHRRYVLYSPREAGWERKLHEDIRNTLRAVLDTIPSEDELIWPYNTFDLHAERATGDLVPSIDSRSLILKGVQLVRNSVAPAFGPHGTAISVAVGPNSHQLPYRRGNQIANHIRSEHPLEAQGVEQMARLASEIYSSVGDATKAGILLSAAMIERGIEAIAMGCVPKHLVTGLQRAVDAAAAHIMTRAKSLTPNETLSVALTAAGADKECTEIVIQAIATVGQDGVIEIIDGGEQSPLLVVEDGIRFDQGFLSPAFVTDTERDECVLDDCYILLYEGQIRTWEELIPLVEQFLKEGKPILCVASDFSEAALSFLVLNKQKGTLSCVAVKTPGHADRRRALLEDMAVLTGGKPLLRESGSPLQAAKLADLGRAGRVVVTRKETTIIDGAGRPDEIAARTANIRRQMAATTDGYDLARLRERLAWFGGGFAVLKSGGLTEADKLDSRYRLESALYSAQTASQNGYVAGGGLTYLRAREQVERLVPSNDSERYGIAAVAYALERPLWHLLQNSPAPNKTAIMKQITQSQSDTLGYNAETGLVEDLENGGVLDSAKALTEALRRAQAHAKGILTTGAWDSGDGESV